MTLTFSRLQKDGWWGEGESGMEGEDDVVVDDGPGDSVAGGTDTRRAELDAGCEELVIKVRDCSRCCSVVGT